MKRSGKKSKRWYAKHRSDSYVRQSRLDGYRSRAAYKLRQIDAKDSLLRRSLQVIDLGAAPGGWSQYARERVGENGRVIAIDQLDMKPIPGVMIIKNDFTSEGCHARIEQTLGKDRIDLVISDAAPNITGMRDVDIARFETLLASVLEFCDRWLREGGDMLVKAFEGHGAADLRQACRIRFERCRVRKPDASRSESKEIYLLCRGFKMTAG